MARGSPARSGELLSDEGLPVTRRLANVTLDNFGRLAA
jgi:hypothetical protein